MRLLIVDDEQLARERLVRMIGRLDGHEVVGEAGNGVTALELAERLQPDLVLLDVRMPGMDGLEAARHLAGFPEPPAVIFCTAYEEHALQAFDLHAVGYLLKPVRGDNLATALDKAQRLNKAQLALLNVGTAERRTHLSVRSHRGIELIPVDEIRYCQADQKYVTVGHSQGEVIIDEPLRDLEQEFAGLLVRIHRGALVAARHIQRLERCADGQARVYLRDVPQALDVSRRHLPALRQLVKQL